MNASGESYSIRRLATIFVGWKCLLLLIACASPGSGYDTSTRILFDQYASTATQKTWLANALEHLVLRLTRWDGIYFASLAERGHVNEQDWAFSWALARFTDRAANALFSPLLSLSSIAKRALTGILISNVAHFLAVITLYELAIELFPTQGTAKARIAFTAAVLHIVSPAGIFLSAPYGESVFAYLTFAGMLYYTRGLQLRKLRVSNITSAESLQTEIFYTIQSGVLFGLAASVRGNGLLNGILFAWDAAEFMLQPARLSSFHELLRFAAIVLAGISVGIGFAGPQLVAYLELCTGEAKSQEVRPWCNKIPPSIYSWVQHHYWGVGFLHYWTLSNVPLFLIAGPVLGLLLRTGYICLRYPQELISRVIRLNSPPTGQRTNLVMQDTVFVDTIRRLALPQLVLVFMAATSFHVQIVNRISSGYPLWSIVLAVAIHSSTWASATTSDNGRKQTVHAETRNPSGLNRITNVLSDRHLQWIVRAMAIYAIIQAGLYASFLPPA